MIMSSQYKIHIKLIHDFFKSSIYIVLNIGVCGMLCHCLCRFVMCYNQPLILSCIFRSCSTERCLKIFTIASASELSFEALGTSALSAFSASLPPGYAPVFKVTKVHYRTDNNNYLLSPSLFSR